MFGIPLRVESVVLPAPVQPSTRVAQVSTVFGLAPRLRPMRVVGPFDLELRSTQLVAVVGPSGSGKSAALDQIARAIPASRHAQRVGLPPDRCVIDCIYPLGPLEEALSILTACGLGEPGLWLRRFDELSDGEKFRARLACAIGAHAESCGLATASEPAPAGSVVPILCDEFCSGLHARAARAVACNLRKLVTRRRLCVLVATCNEALLPDLQPDVTVRLSQGGRHTLETRHPSVAAISFRRRLHIEPGSKSDYAEFAAMHYREADELGFVDKIFVLRERGSGQALGIVVYAHAPLELALRNRATGRRFCRNPRLLNREVRILRRLIIHPDVRGCGLGRRLVERTLPRVGVPYVECLAAMGQMHPVFERAGMTRVGLCDLPPEQAAACAELKSLGVDPLGPDFVQEACRSPRVRQIVAGCVQRWYRATTGEGAERVERQSPRFLARLFRGLAGSRPVYYLWRSRRTRMCNAEFGNERAPRGVLSNRTPSAKDRAGSPA